MQVQVLPRPPNLNIVMKNTQAAAESAKTGAFLQGLRVRIKELAQEARFIRHEEEKIKGRQKIGNDLKSNQFWKLRNHRKDEVRPAARAAQLAYGFLRDVPYRQIEPTSKEPTGYWEQKVRERLIKEMKRLATKFSKNGTINFDSEIEEWFKKVLDD